MKSEKQLKKEIFDKVVEYHNYIIKPETFIPGKTKISYADRLYNEKELSSLIDSALDFWLTGGRFAAQFEKEFAKFLEIKHCLLRNSGSSTNLLVISALTSQELEDKRLKPGDEIVTVATHFACIITRHPCFKNVNYRIYGELTNTDHLMNDFILDWNLPWIDKKNDDLYNRIFR